MKIISKIDNTCCKTMLGLSIHLKKYNLSILDYFKQYENVITPICKFCNKNNAVLKSKNRFINNKPNFTDYCYDKQCIKKHQSELGIGRIITKKTKDKIRIGRVNYLKNKNRNLTGFEKKQKNLFTFGEEWLHNIFINQKLYEKYDIINEFCEFPYFIDFAFINEKVAVEFDGSTHFKFGNKRIEHDIKRDKYLQEKGWRMFRIAYFEMKTFKLESLLNFIGNSKEKEFSNQLIKYKEFKDRKNNFYKFTKITKNYFIKRIKINEKILKVSSSNIDFSKFGWVQKVSNILNITPQNVNRWMKKYMKDFYQKCFKRKT
jgi:very-short-patch-repair endonuclease